MSTEAARARRSRQGSPARTKLDTRPKLTFAMIELADPADCNGRRKLWRRKRGYGYRDVTPVFGGRSKVPSLNGKIVETDAFRCLEQLEAVDADWYMLSGHHGRLYQADQNIFRTPSGETDSRRYWDELDHTGFFNEEYHHGRWKQVLRRKQRGTSGDEIGHWVGATEWEPKTDTHYWDRRNNRRKYTRRTRKTYVDNEKYELYLSMTGTPSTHLAPFITDNPILVPSMQSARATRCKGVILSACNTLSFRKVRIALDRYFPNAVFIGIHGTIARGKELSRAIRKAKLCNRAFWEDPAAVLTDEATVKELTLQLQRGLSKRRKVAVMFQKRFYVGIYFKGGYHVLADDFGMKFSQPAETEP